MVVDVEGECRGSGYTWVGCGRTIGEAPLELLRCDRGLKKLVESCCDGGVSRGEGDAASMMMV